jgi:pyruvate ferredoxin oxidoreductase gamma subunit
MYQVRIHGRGGQGVVTAAELLSVAAFTEGRHAQAFPTFGSERSGAPVVSFCRIADRPIRVHEPILEPDALIVQDPTLLHMPGLFDGLRPDGRVLVNSSREPADLGIRGRVLTVPATKIAREHLGRPLPNVALLAGLCAFTGVVSLEALEQAVAARFPAPLAERNVAAARTAHAHVLREQEAVAC